MVRQFDHLMVRQIYNKLSLEQQQKFPRSASATARSPKARSASAREAQARAKRKRDSAQPQRIARSPKGGAFNDDGSERDQQRAHTTRKQVAGLARLDGGSRPHRRTEAH